MSPLTFKLGWQKRSDAFVPPNPKELLMAALGGVAVREESEKTPLQLSEVATALPTCLQLEKSEDGFCRFRVAGTRNGTAEGDWSPKVCDPLPATVSTVKAASSAPAAPRR